MLFIPSSGAQTGHVLVARLRVLSLNSSFPCPDSPVQFLGNRPFHLLVCQFSLFSVIQYAASFFVCFQ